MTVKIDDSDMPNLFARADEEAVSRQRRHVALQIVYLAGTVVVALLEAISLVVESNESTYFAIGIGVLVVATVAFLFDYWSESAGKWQHSRRVAETAKSMSWLYVMGWGDYSIDDEHQSRSLLSRRLNQTVQLEEAEWLGFGEPEQIELSEPMSKVRALDDSGRLEVYRRDRILDQQRYFADRHRQLRLKWLAMMWLTGASLLAALIIGIVVLVSDSTEFGLIIPLLAAAPAFIGWSEARRYKQFRETYGETAGALVRIERSAEIRLGSSPSRDEILRLVEDIERTIADENVSWLARQTGEFAEDVRFTRQATDEIIEEILENAEREESAE